MKNCNCNNMMVMRKCDLLKLASLIWNEATELAENQTADVIIDDEDEISVAESKLLQRIDDNMIWADDAEIPSTVCGYLSELGYDF